MKTVEWDEEVAKPVLRLSDAEMERLAELAAAGDGEALSRLLGVIA